MGTIFHYFADSTLPTFDQNIIEDMVPRPDAISQSFAFFSDGVGDALLERSETLLTVLLIMSKLPSTPPTLPITLATLSPMLLILSAVPPWLELS